MSVLIKDMEMPNNCYDCPFIRASYAGDYYCAKGNSTEEDLKKVYGQRMADCPLIEIPTPHGRLVDIKSVEEWKSLAVDEDYQEGWNDALYTIIENVPTVIEAEGSEE